MSDTTASRFTTGEERTLQVVRLAHAAAWERVKATQAEYQRACDEFGEITTILQLMQENGDSFYGGNNVLPA